VANVFPLTYLKHAIPAAQLIQVDVATGRAFGVGAPGAVHPAGSPTLPARLEFGLALGPRRFLLASPIAFLTGDLPVSATLWTKLHRELCGWFEAIRKRSGIAPQNYTAERVRRFSLERRPGRGSRGAGIARDCSEGLLGQSVPFRSASGAASVASSTGSASARSASAAIVVLPCHDTGAFGASPEEIVEELLASERHEICRASTLLTRPLSTGERTAPSAVSQSTLPTNSHSDAMPKTVEAIVDEEGAIQLPDSISLKRDQRVLVTIPEDSDDESTSETTISATASLSEAALAEDWTREEENEAWTHLQPDQ
jgi:hypothetical protein